MTEAIGFGTAFQNEDENSRWESAEGVDVTQEEVIENVGVAIRQMQMTEQEFNEAEPLYLTEIRIVRQLTWEDVR